MNPNEPSLQTSLDLSVLNAPQKEAVTWGDGPLLILAGAGSGKTRVITYRIAHLLETGVKPWNILAVTFTNKAAGEMRERVHKLTQGKGAGVWVSTFHSFCAQFLRVEGPHFGLDRGFTIYDEDDQKKVLKECLHELNLSEKKLNPGTLASRISREKDQLMDAESYSIAALASGDPNREMFAAIYQRYQQKLDRAMALDFGDLILKTVELLHEHALLREKYQNRFHYVLVDEYQDTNRAQYTLVKILGAKYKNICVVGDDDQSIYSWRGADIHNILDFEKDYDQVKVVKLEQNYRSTQPILSAAWKLVQNNEKRKDKQLWTTRQSDQPVAYQLLDSELMEADWIASKVSILKEDLRLPFNSFAIFYRTNAQSRVLEDALRNSQIPYVIVGGVRFYERAEVKDVLAYLKLVSNPKDDVSFKRVINFPARGIGKTSLEAVEKFALEQGLSLFEAVGRGEILPQLNGRARENIAQFRAMIEDWVRQRETMPVFEMVKRILDRTKILSTMEEEAKDDTDAASRLDNVQEMLNATEEFQEKSEDKTVRAYLEQVSLITDLDLVDNRKNGVTLMTIHIAKGLEFPVVFLTGLEEGLFPLGETQFDPEELEEERRIAYVGMTRAKDLLFLTSAATRRLYGQTHWNLPSRFIEEAGLVVNKRPPIHEASGDDWSEPPRPRLPEPAEPRSASGDRGFRVGQRVRHPEFGSGKITQQTGSGDDLKVVVLFDSGQWKKLLVKYAPLERD